MVTATSDLVLPAERRRGAEPGPLRLALDMTWVPCLPFAVALPFLFGTRPRDGRRPRPTQLLSKKTEQSRPLGSILEAWCGDCAMLLDK